MQLNQTKLTGIIWRLLSAAVIPFVVISAYLLLKGWLFHGASRPIWETDFAFAVAVISGCAMLLTMPIRLTFRVCCLPLYAIIIWLLLVPYTLLFIAVVFRAIIP